MNAVDSAQLHDFGDLTNECWAFDEYVPTIKRDTMDTFRKHGAIYNF